MIHEFDGVPNPKQLEKLLTSAMEDAIKSGVGAVAINLGDLQCNDPDCECKANVTPADGSQIGKISEPVVEDDPTEDLPDIDSNLGFAQVITGLEQGGIAWRDVWGKGEFFIFRQVPAEIPLYTIPKMQSLPSLVKRTFLLRASANDHSDQFTSIRYTNQYALVLDDNRIEGYSPSVDDVRASDWNVAL